jgi:hypothetical protein
LAILQGMSWEAASLNLQPGRPARTTLVNNTGCESHVNPKRNMIVMLGR